MKSVAAAATLLAVAAAAPSAIRARNATAAFAASSTGVIFPNVVALHYVNTNENTLFPYIATGRYQGEEATTLFQLPIPAEAAGKTCHLQIFAGGIADLTDSVAGTGELDIFNNNIVDLANTETGNFRNNELARVVFNPDTGFFDFVSADVTPKIQNFPCPAGKTLEWEAVSVGTEDVVIISQDFAPVAGQIPNGLVITFN